ncbi:MAG: alcohol dehydrogenase catalytic domain-containing protein [Gemmatimonadota bacterium]
MQAALLLGYGIPLVTDTQPDPVPAADGVVLQVLACGVCRSDWHVWHGDWQWRMPLEFPHVLGHEVVGEVVARGSGVEGFPVGTRVVVPFHQDCGRCPQCAGGSANLCDNYTAIGFQRPGGFAEYIAIEGAARNLIPIPEAVDPLIAAALGCRVMTAWHALQDRAPATGNDRIVIVGSGGLGLAALLVAKYAGARVTMVDLNPESLVLAHQLGADATLLLTAATREAVTASLGGTATISIDAVGHASAAAVGIMALGRQGRHLQLGLSGAGEQGAFSVPIDHIVKSEIAMFGSVGAPIQSHRTLVDAMSQGAFGLAGLNPRQVALDGVTSIFDEMSDGTLSGLAVVVP